MLFFELYKIMVKKVTFVGFRGAIAPTAPPGSAPEPGGSAAKGGPLANIQKKVEKL